jgi:hypothetical protein
VAESQPKRLGLPNGSEGKNSPGRVCSKIAHSGGKTSEPFAGMQALETLVVSGILCQRIHYERVI